MHIITRQQFNELLIENAMKKISEKSKKDMMMDKKMKLKEGSKKDEMMDKKGYKAPKGVKAMASKVFGVNPFKKK